MAEQAQAGTDVAVQAGPAQPTRINGKRLTRKGEAELERQIKSVTQQMGALAAGIAHRAGSETISPSYVRTAAQKLDLAHPPGWRQALETITVFLLGAVISTIIQLVVTAEEVSQEWWLTLGATALVLAPVATALMILNRRS